MYASTEALQSWRAWEFWEEDLVPGLVKLECMTSDGLFRRA
jgi:hypothetical protein